MDGFLVAVGHRLCANEVASESEPETSTQEIKWSMGHSRLPGGGMSGVGDQLAEFSNDGRVDLTGMAN